MTEAGVILGTAAYMPPEQAQGAPVDKRADIWAFGVILYELLTGQRLFKGDTITATLAAVIEREPDWNRAPAKARRLLKKCLEKDPKRRLRDIGDAWELIEDPEAGDLRHKWSWVWPGVATAFFAAAAALAFIHFRETQPVSEPARFEISAPENASLAYGRGIAVSPDGRKVAFVAGQSSAGAAFRLFVRGLDSLDVRELPGTEGVRTGPPIWSPDSRFVAFWADGKLKRIDVSGGSPQSICDWPGGDLWSGAWRSDGLILFGTMHGVMRVPAAGGVAAPLTMLDSSAVEQWHDYPAFLPDGKQFLYFRATHSPETRGLYLGSLDLKPQEQSPKRLLKMDFGPVYVPSSNSVSSGTLLFLRDDALLAQTFDANKLEMTGEPLPIVEKVRTSCEVNSNGNCDYGYFSASANGVLAYVSGGNLERQLTWFDRQGKIVGVVGEKDRYTQLVLSRDGTTVGVTLTQGGHQDLWMVHLPDGNRARFSFGTGWDSYPVWSPDGGRVAFHSFRSGTSGLYWKRASGAGMEEMLLKLSQSSIRLADWSSDSRFLLYSDGDLWVLPLDGDRMPLTFLRTPFAETEGQLSKDGQWVAYRSDESGRWEVYVQRFKPAPNAGASADAGKWLVSNGGAAGPLRWRRDGKELYYQSSDGKVMAVDVTAGPELHHGPPKALFQVPPAFLRSADPSSPLADVASDGQRFLFAMPVTEDRREGITVLLDWQAALKK
jgi:Tol biopolymer transport system component